MKSEIVINIEPGDTIDSPNFIEVKIEGDGMGMMQMMPQILGTIIAGVMGELAKRDLHFPPALAYDAAQRGASFAVEKMDEALGACNCEYCATRRKIKGMVNRAVAHITNDGAKN